MIKQQLLILLLCIVLLGVECMSAQQKEVCVIRGTIEVRAFSGQLHATLIDATGRTVADSIFRERTFRIAPALPGVYHLKLKTEGYQAILRTVHPTAENPVVELGKIPMQILRDIDQVIVTGERTFVRSTANGFVYDVLSDPDAKKLKINEFFGKVPGVWNDQSKGQIVYEDNRKYLILVNGKKHAMISASRQYAMNHIRADHMKTIEVMDPAPAEWANEADVVIDIQLAKELPSGIVGFIDPQITTLGSYYADAGLTYKYLDLILTANYSLAGSAPPQVEQYHRPGARTGR